MNTCVRRTWLGAGGGFTLIEVLVAVGLVGALAVGFLSFLDGASARRAAMEKESGRQRAVGALTEALETDVLTCVAQGPRGAPGIVGSVSGLTILARGSPAPGVASSRSESVGDLQRAEYRYEGGGVSLRRADAVSSSADRQAVLGRDIGLVRFRYLAGREWVSAFDSAQAGRLPAAIEVAVWFDVPLPPSQATGLSPSSESAPTWDAEAEADLPPADRVRVIAVPEAAEGEVRP